MNSEGHLLIVFRFELNVNDVDYPAWNDSLRMEIVVTFFGFKNEASSVAFRFIRMLLR